MITIALFRRLLLSTFMLAAGAAISTVSAQTAAPSATALSNPTPSATSIALAKELLTLKGGSQMFDGTVLGIIESAKDAYLPNNPQLSKPLNEVAAQLRQEFEPKKAELFNEVSRAYARHFTDQELRELLAFYKTTLGKKALVSESLAVEDGFKRAQEWTNQFSDIVLTRMRAEMKKKGFDL
jgi:hypothetical protein